MQKNLGIIDSGIGGLTILRDLLPYIGKHNLFYISDEDNVPYGSKSQSFMYQRTALMVENLIRSNVSLIVLACNTLTAETIDKLRENYSSIEFFGIEPYINYLNRDDSLKDKKIGLILTHATNKSKKFQSLRSRVDPNKIIEVIPMNHLAMIIESLKTKSFDDVKDAILSELSPVKKHDLDILILGCTHYPIIDHFIESELKVRCINPHKFLINRIVEFLALGAAQHQETSFNYDSNLSGKWRKVDIKDFHFLFLNT